MFKTLITLISTLLALQFFTFPASAGSRSYNEPGFIIFDLFAAAPNSKYRKQNSHRGAKPQVRGFHKKVGGYSYKYEDTLQTYSTRPTDFNPIFEGHLFSSRIGENGSYVGD